MTREEIITLAEKVGFDIDESERQVKDSGNLWITERIEALVREIENTTLERAAKLCESEYPDYDSYMHQCFNTPKECAAAIRALKGE